MARPNIGVPIYGRSHTSEIRCPNMHSNELVRLYAPYTSQFFYVSVNLYYYAVLEQINTIFELEVDEIKQ